MEESEEEDEEEDDGKVEIVGEEDEEDGEEEESEEEEYDTEDGEEIEEEDLDHQVFYTVGSGLDVTTEYSNNDSAGNPLGTQFKLIAGSASSGNLTFTLKHEPTKPNTGLASAGGSTDIETTFSITIE